MCCRSLFNNQNRESAIQTQAMLGDWNQVDKILHQARNLAEVDRLIGRAVYGAAAFTSTANYAPWANACQNILLNLNKNYGFSQANLLEGIAGARLRKKCNKLERPPAPEGQNDPLEMAFNRVQPNPNLSARNNLVVLAKNNLKVTGAQIASAVMLAAFYVLVS